jgi:hypothetical protein
LFILDAQIQIASLKYQNFQNEERSPEFESFRKCILRFFMVLEAKLPKFGANISTNFEIF